MSFCGWPHGYGHAPMAFRNAMKARNAMITVTSITPKMVSMMTVGAR